MADWNDRARRWMLAHWPWGPFVIGACCAGVVAVFDLLISGSMTRSEPGYWAGWDFRLALQTALMTFLVARGLRRLRAAQGSSSTEDVVHAMAAVDAGRAPSTLSQRRLAESYALCAYVGWAGQGGWSCQPR